LNKMGRCQTETSYLKSVLLWLQEYWTGPEVQVYPLKATALTPQQARRATKEEQFSATNLASAPERRALSFHQHSTAQLVAGRDLSRQHAELIDLPVADEHLDRGQHFPIAAHALGAAPALSPQAFEIDCRYISIVSHDPSPSQCRRGGSAPKMAVRWQRGRISVDADQIFRKACCHGNRTCNAENGALARWQARSLDSNSRHSFYH
jgi:hypothetical protein